MYPSRIFISQRGILRLKIKPKSEKRIRAYLIKKTLMNLSSKKITQVFSGGKRYDWKYIKKNIMTEK